MPALSCPRLLPLAMLIVSLSFFSSCSVSNKVKVEVSKPVAKPFTSLLLIFSDHPFSFIGLDSLTYETGIRGCFTDTTDVPYIKKVEQSLTEEMSSYQVLLTRSTDVFGPQRNSYHDFLHVIDSMEIDGILVINLAEISYQSVDLPGNRRYAPPPGFHPARTGPPGAYDPDIKYNESDAAFKCCLIPSHQLLPTWQALFETERNEVLGAQGFTSTIRKGMAIAAKKMSERGYFDRAPQ